MVRLKIRKCFVCKSFTFKSSHCDKKTSPVGHKFVDVAHK